MFSGLGLSFSNEDLQIETSFDADGGRDSTWQYDSLRESDRYLLFAGARFLITSKIALFLNTEWSILNPGNLEASEKETQRAGRSAAILNNPYRMTKNSESQFAVIFGLEILRLE